MNTISKAAFAVFSLGSAAIAGQAQADTIVRFLPKSGVPYTVTRPESHVIAPAYLGGPKSVHPIAHVKARNPTNR